MSDTPSLTSDDRTAPNVDSPPDTDVTPTEDASGERRRLHEIWVSGTEEPEWVRAATDEGAQELLPEAHDPGAATQRGTLVDDDFVVDDAADDDERQILNMGPQHPSTHGVLRLQLELVGETVRRVKPIIGYLHTGMEKTGETLTWLQGPTNVTRMDYLSPFHNELVFSLAVEQLLGVVVPPRAQAIRVLMTELNRVSSHTLFLATQGMDLGASSVMIYGWRERERLLNFFETVTGLRMNHNYIRPGGVAADLPDGWEDDVEVLLDIVPKGVAEIEELLNENPIFLDRTLGVGVITPEECKAYGVTGPMARASGIDWDLRRDLPYSGVENYEFDVPLGKHGDVFDRYIVRVKEVYQSMRIVAQILETLPAGDYRTEDRKVTPPPRKRIDESMEALIHHFKIFTEGFKVPAGEIYQAVEGPRGAARRLHRLQRDRQAVAGPCQGAVVRPCPGAPGDDVGLADRRCDRHPRLDRSGAGRRRPMTARPFDKVLPDWTPANRERARMMLEQYPEHRSAVMPLLYLASLEHGHVTDEGMRQVGELTGLTSAQVRSVASFYTMYKRDHVGRYLVSVCTSISCFLLGADDVLAAIEDETGTPDGESSTDGVFSVEHVECLGACGGAPAVQVNYELVEGVTPEQGRNLCRWLRTDSPDVVFGDEMQDRFGGQRSFDWGPVEIEGAVVPVPAFGPYGSVGMKGES